MAQISFNSNAPSQRVQRELAGASRSLGKAYERLSTGLRINRASDDAAGLAIAEQLKTNARLYSTASRNINDGISTLNIIDGALEQQSNAVQRLVELAQQASNGSLSSAQRNSLNAEYRSLVKEISRVGETTSFNGLRLLQGSRGNISRLLLQAGITGGSNSQLGINTADTSSMSGKVDLSNIATDVAGGKYNSSEALLQAYNGVVMRTSVVTVAGQTEDILIGFSADSIDPYGSEEALINFNVYGHADDGVGWKLETTGQFSYFTDTGKVENNDVFANLEIQSLSFLVRGVSASLTVDLRALTFVGQTAMSKPGALASAGSALEFSGVETQSAALSALTYAKERLSQLASIRGDMGAVASRLMSAESLSQVNMEGALTAEQRIRDADIAEEAANLTGAQIRQQSAAQVLSLANFQPQLLLSLLQNA